MKLPDPTDAPAGSDAKIDAMRSRADQRQPIFHPDDSIEMVEQRPDPEPPPGSNIIQRK